MTFRERASVPRPLGTLADYCSCHSLSSPRSARRRRYRNGVSRMIGGCSLPFTGRRVRLVALLLVPQTPSCQAADPMGVGTQVASHVLRPLPGLAACDDHRAGLGKVGRH